jgi:hypothetical protein
MLVVLPALASVTVMPAISTKSREVIWGGQIMGAEIHARHAREEARKADVLHAAALSSFRSARDDLQRATTKQTAMNATNAI